MESAAPTIITSCAPYRRDALFAENTFDLESLGTTSEN